MGRHKQSQEWEFSYEGRFLGFTAVDGYKLKYLKLGTHDGEQPVKIPKELRHALYRDLLPGDWLVCTGTKKLDPVKGTTKLKALTVERTGVKDRDIPLSSCSSAERSTCNLQANASSSPKHADAKIKILICQKSDCVRRGSGEVCTALMNALGDRNLDGQVAIKHTGCLKHCKAGPNIVLMPDKSRYSNVKIKEVPAIVEAISCQVMGNAS